MDSLVAVCNLVDIVIFLDNMTYTVKTYNCSVTGLKWTQILNSSCTNAKLCPE